MTDNEKRFLNLVGPKAVNDYKQNGILASITLAQACLESGFGTTELASKANNLFGMKVGLSGENWGTCWDGKSKYTKVTQEQRADGSYYSIIADFRKYANIDLNIKDHSLYLANAKNGNQLRYKGLVGEKNYRQAAQIIKDGGYATSLTYVDKLCNLIERLNLTKYDKMAEQNTYIQKFMTLSPYYTNPTIMEVKGLMLHSTGHPQPNAMNYYNYWNNPNFDAQCTHGLIDGNTGQAYQILPWNYQAAHCGKGPNGSGNTTHIAVEMCEPAELQYTSQFTFNCANVEKARATAERTYNTAVKLFAELCKLYNLNPLADGVIIGHWEGHLRGIASAHEDPEHFWNGLGLSYTMDGFREDVYNALNGKQPEEPAIVNNFPKTPFQVRVIIDDLNYRSQPLMGDQYVVGQTGKGVFTIVEVRDNEWGKLKSGAGWIYIANPAYCTILNTVQAQPVFSPYKVKITANALNYRRGPGVEYGVNGVIRDKGIYTIAEEKDGWGRLLSGAGWINLYYTKKL